MKSALILALLLLRGTSLFAEAIDYGYAEQVKLSILKGELYLDNLNLKELKEGMTITASLGLVINIEGERYDFKDYLRNQIIEQVSYLYGVMQSPYLSQKLKLHGGVGILGESQTVTNVKVKRILGKRTYFTYSYNTKALVNREILTGGEASFQTLLPATNDEKIIFNKVCTDPHYESFGDYWYFFDSERPACKAWLLKASDRAIDTFVKIEQPDSYENEAITYPEYQKIYDDSEVKSFVFFGFDENPEMPKGNITVADITKAVNEQKKSVVNDVGTENFEDFIRKMKSRGFRIVNEKRWFSLAYDNLQGRNLIGANQFVSLERKVGDKRSVVDVLLSNTSTESTDATFAIYYKQAVENYELISYSGHSGLGANLDIVNININLSNVGIKKINMKKMPYQIFFFNGCSTYSYFNREYFKAKGGSKKMESITTGLPSYFSDSVRNSIAFLLPFVDFTLKSYAAIIDDIERENRTNGPTLIFVNGAEDNPTTPP